MNSREMLIDTTSYMAPARILEGLSASDADRRLPGAPHSVADILAHVVYWQEWFTRRAQGAGEPMAAHASLGWPGRSGEWTELRQRFSSGLSALAALDEEGARKKSLSPPLEFPPLAHYTVGDVLVHVAQHNAYHFGQIAFLRQLLGAWPPPGGSYTW